MSKPCVLCRPGEPAEVYRLPKVRVLECRACGLAYVDEDFDPADVAELYEAENYYEDNFSYFVPGIEERVIEDNLEDFSRLPLEGGRVLDVGCADGEFLRQLPSERWERHGVDISEAALARARRSVPDAEFRVGTVAEAGYPDDFFDVVVLWMVVEHLQDPVGVLREIQRIVRPGGLVVLKTPNRDSLLASIAHWLYRLSGRRIDGPIQLYYTFLHLYFFDPGTLGAILEDTGFDVADVWQEERYLTRHALGAFPFWQRPAFRAVVLASRAIGKMDSFTIVGRKRGP